LGNFGHDHDTYLGNFFLLAFAFLEEEKRFVSASFRWVAPAENSLNDLTPEQVDLFFSSLSKTQRQKADKVNWKVEGF
jgi:hypothetical protein